MKACRDQQDSTIRTMMNLDLFARPITLTLNKKQYFHTCHGVCLSLALIAFIAWISAQRVMMLKNSYLISTVVQEEQDLNSTINMTS